MIDSYFCDFQPQYLKGLSWKRSKLIATSTWFFMIALSIGSINLGTIPGSTYQKSEDG